MGKIPIVSPETGESVRNIQLINVCILQRSTITIATDVHKRPVNSSIFFTACPPPQRKYRSISLNTISTFQRQLTWYRPLGQSTIFGYILEIYLQRSVYTGDHILPRRRASDYSRRYFQIFKFRIDITATRYRIFYYIYFL